MFIYKITNIINSKIYIGQTSKSIEERWKGHKFHKGCTALHNAIKKYGENNFKIDILCIELNKIYGSQAEAARELNLYQANIFKVINGQRKSTGGYTFKNIGDIHGKSDY